MKFDMQWLTSFATESILPAVIMVAIGILIVRGILGILDMMLAKMKMEKGARGLIRSAAKVVLYLLLALAALEKLGVDVTGIVAMASVLTLAISLSVQDLLTNVIGGFTLLYTKPFVSGDVVEIAGQTGTVKEIGLTYTKLATADNKLVSIPNKSVVATEITNHSSTGTRRVELVITASYDAPVDHVISALLEAAAVPTALEDPAPFAAVHQYGDSAIAYVVRVWSTAEDYWTTHYDVNRKVKEVFDAKGIEMTYPHLHVHLDK